MLRKDVLVECSTGSIGAREWAREGVVLPADEEIFTSVSTVRSTNDPLPTVRARMFATPEKGVAFW